MDARLVSEWRRLDRTGQLSIELRNFRNRLEACEIEAYVAFATLSEGGELPDGFSKVIVPEIESWVESVLTDQASVGEAYERFLLLWRVPDAALLPTMPGDTEAEQRRRMWGWRSSSAEVLREHVNRIELVLCGADEADGRREEEVADALSPQEHKVFLRLKKTKHYVAFESLAEVPGAWRNDPDSVSDEAIMKKIRRINEKVSDFGYSIDTSSRRAKLDAFG